MKVNPYLGFSLVVKSQFEISFEGITLNSSRSVILLDIYKDEDYSMC
jgi:hypothetical protein